MRASSSPKPARPTEKTGFANNADAAGCEVVIDSKGTLLWPDAEGMDKPYLIITSSKVSKEYLDYLDSRHISWIAAGEHRADLAAASDILAEKFDVERMAVVGGPVINTAFLDSGLLDEISILIGAGIDGRRMPSVFDGREADTDVIPLQLSDVQKFASGAVWLRYKV